MLRRALIIAFLALFVLEVYLIVQVGGAVGFWPTFGLLLAGALLGSWIIRREGRRAWRALHGTVMGGALPDRELADSALVMAGGLLLVAPGFVTDVAGLLFVLPVTRPLVRRLLAGVVARQIQLSQERLQERVGAYSPEGLGIDGLFPPADGKPQGAPGPGRHGGPVIRGRIVREDRPEG